MKTVQKIETVDDILRMANNVRANKSNEHVPYVKRGALVYTADTVQSTLQISGDKADDFIIAEITAEELLQALAAKCGVALVIGDIELCD
jgi:hypothetical protein